MYGGALRAIKKRKRLKQNREEKKTDILNSYPGRRSRRKRHLQAAGITTLSERR
jgi:hypothetical protein